MKKSKDLNITPTSNNMVITANLIKVDTKLVLLHKPTFSSVQQVLAIGPRVDDVKVGDWIYIDLQRFVKHVKVKSTIKAGVGGQDMIKEEFVPPAFVAPGDPNGAYFKITDREHEGVIVDFKKLPKELKEFTLVIDFEKAIEKATKQATADKLAFDKERSDKAAIKRKDSKKFSKSPAIKAEGIYRG